MKFSCTQENLYKGLSIVARVASRNNALPILNNLLLRATRTGLEVVATNLEVAILTAIRGKIEGEGTITVNSKLLTDSVALLPNERVDINLSNNDLELVCGKHHTTIRGVPADDFPVIPEVNPQGSLRLPASEFEAALNQVVFTVNAEESRPEIAGVFMGMVDGGLVVVGTDSYRLAERRVGGVVGKISAERLIIPLRTAQEVARILGSVETEEVELVTSETQAVWQLGETRVISRLVAGQYPDYQQIIPKSFATTTKLSRDELMRAVRAASLFVRAGVNDVRLQFKIGSSQLVVSSINSQLGENTTELQLTGAQGEENEIVFNYRYLLEGLQAMPSDEVVLEVVNSKSPGLVKPTTGSGYVYIIMPIRQ